MATEILRPNAAGDEEAASFVPNGAATLWECISEAVADEDATNISRTGVSTETFLVNVEPSSFDISATINSVTIFVRLKASSATPRIRAKENGIASNSGLITDTSSYADYSRVMTVRPSDSLSWTKSDVDALQIGLTDGNSTVDLKLTQMWIEVDYTPAAVAAVPQRALLGVGQ